MCAEVYSLAVVNRVGRGGVLDWASCTRALHLQGLSPAPPSLDSDFAHCYRGSDIVMGLFESRRRLHLS